MPLSLAAIGGAGVSTAASCHALAVSAPAIHRAPTARPISLRYFRLVILSDLLHGTPSMEIAAFGSPRAIAYLPVGLGDAGGAVAQRVQLVGKVDQLVGDDVDDEALALYSAAHQ